MRPWYIPVVDDSTALLLGTPLTHALYLKAHVEKYANIDEWGDFLLNDPAHAGTSRKLTQNKFAKELSKALQSSKWMWHGNYLQRITITLSLSGPTRSKQEKSRYDNFFRWVCP